MNGVWSRSVYFGGSSHTEPQQVALDVEWKIGWLGVFEKEVHPGVIWSILWVWPPPSNSGKWRCSSGSPTKNVIILVVTVTGRGPHPIYINIVLKELPQLWIYNDYSIGSPWFFESHIPISVLEWNTWVYHQNLPSINMFDLFNNTSGYHLFQAPDFGSL